MVLGASGDFQPSLRDGATTGRGSPRWKRGAMVASPLRGWGAETPDQVEANEAEVFLVVPAGAGWQARGGVVLQTSAHGCGEPWAGAKGWEEAAPLALRRPRTVSEALRRVEPGDLCGARDGRGARRVGSIHAGAA